MASLNRIKVLLLVITMVVVCEIPTTSSESPAESNILRVLQNNLNHLQERIKIDLNEKFSQLSSQLDENNKKVVKTLTIFENEWNEKAERLNLIEERQQRVENVVVKLTKMVHELKEGQNNLEQLIQQKTIVVHASEEKEDDDLDEIILIKNSTFYSLSGTKSSYQRVKRIPPEEQSDLRIIELHYVEIVPHVLLDSLQNCTNLKELKLIHVKLLGDFNDRVYLPSLTQFTIHQDDIFQFPSTTIFTKWSEIDDYLQGFDAIAFKSLIFFDKNITHLEDDWDIEDIPKLKTNIDLEVDGIKLFEISHRNGEINSMLKFGSDVVKNANDDDFTLNRLSLSSWRLDITSFPATITHLNFNYVLMPNETGFNRNLSKFKYLQDLNMFIGNRRERSLPPFPDSIRNLTLRFTNLNYNPYQVKKTLNLDFLYFHFCRISSEFAENFHKLFHSRNVAVTFRRNNTGTIDNISHKLLYNILKVEITSWIFIKNFQRTLSDKVQQEDDQILYKEVEEFLQSTGIPKHSENFVLGKKYGIWRGKEISGEELMLLTFQLAGTNKFVTFSTYKRLVE